MFTKNILGIMKWSRNTIITHDGQEVEAQAPVIISASRSTDIPAFYSDWFVERLAKGYVKWKNPFNGAYLYVSFANARLIVFWTKNPKPLIKHFSRIDSIIPNYYFQYTLNDYENDQLEIKVPPLAKRIETFIELSELIGSNRVIWRFDPLLITSNIDINTLLRRIENIGDQLKNHTKKLVFSFADIKNYRKVQNNLKRENIHYLEFNERLMNEFAAGLQQINKKWDFEIGTCAEGIDLNKFNIKHNKCIDDELIIRLFSQDKSLMNFLGVEFQPETLFSNSDDFKIKRDNKDKGQREFCGCIISKDIGEYNTCPHLCEYCYANTSKEIALANYKRHKERPFSEMILGD